MLEKFGNHMMLTDQILAECLLLGVVIAIPNKAVTNVQKQWNKLECIRPFQLVTIIITIILLGGTAV